MNKNKLIEKVPLNILWVDDNFIISESANILVEFIGHKCDNVMNAHDALKHLNKNSYDVVFTDIGMPEMNGWELADAIREKFGNSIKIVAVTGWNIEDTIKEKHGINLVLQKPFTLDQLKETFLML
jgi:CheY-like chemotaxis protein